MITGTEAFYEKLQKFDWYYMDDKSEYNYASQWIKPSDLVLEIGCGKAAFSDKITAKEYIGLEFSQNAKLLANKPNLVILNESIEEHANKHKEAYSIVCAFQVLEHISDIHSFIKASIDCLKPGGLLIYSIPSADSFIYCAKNNILNMPPHHISWWSDRALNYVSNLFGLKLVDIHHEKLSEIHKRWYSSLIISQALEKIVGFHRHQRLIDLSLGYKILLKISSFGGAWLAKGLGDPKVLPNGHSVTVVYQKSA
jgi:SAM-dependent methyltransferase